MLLNIGTQERYIAEATLGAGSTSREGSTRSDAILVTLFVNSVTTGNLSLSIVTLTDTGKEVEVISFPTVSAPTTNLLLRKSGVTMQRFRIDATYTGQCDYEVYVRAVQGAGESSVRILGAGSLSTDSVTVTTVPSALIPAALTDRNGLTIKNFAGGSVLYVSESLSKLPADAWPIGPGEVWSLDVTAGVTIYAVAGSGSLDIRTAESGT